LARLESVCTGNGTAGSNPALSASRPEKDGFFLWSFVDKNQNFLMIFPSQNMPELCIFAP
jgi:hypothetical protein